VIAAGSDRLAPRVAITQPEDAATVQSSTDLTVTYVSASEQPIVRVDIWIDDGRVVTYKLEQPRQKGKVQFALHTQDLTNGEHRLQAQVFDAAGHAGQARITVRVQNEATPTPAPKVAPSGPDLIPPSVTVRQPQNGARVGGRMQVSVEATDDTKVICVLLFVDDEFAAIQNYPPYNFDIRTTNLSEGVHTTYASAFDGAQNKGESAKVYFTVDNARATTPSAEAPPRETGPDSVSIGPGLTDAPSRGPEVAAVPTPERVGATTTSAPRPGPEIAAQSRHLPTAERMASAPRLVMPDSAAGPAASPQPVTSRATLHVDQASASRTAAPQRTRVALLGPKATRPAVPPASRRAAVSAADARMPMRTSTTAYTPTPSRTPSGQMASLPSAPVRETGGPAASYSPVKTAPAIASPETTSPSRTMVASAPTATRPPAPRGSAPAVVRTDRGERYAMLPRNVVTVASPKRDAETTSSGQRVSSPGAMFLEAKHVIHLGDKSVPVEFDNELLKLRTLATERAGVPVGPFREIFEHTGGVVHWYADDRRVTAYSHAATVELRIGNDHAKVDDETVWLELAPFIKDGRTMVPFAFLKKLMDVTVRYDPKSGRIQITSNKF
jgi:hypothetical protein